MINFKPMLAGKCENLTLLKYPLLVSAKLDGVRAIVIDGTLMSRSLKPIPNKYAQSLFRHLPSGTDGELIVGKADDDPYRRTVSAVMGEDGIEKALRFWTFDNYTYAGGFSIRNQMMSMSVRGKNQVLSLPHVKVNNEEELLSCEREFVDVGYEGLMIRSIEGPYKFGRSTEREGYLLKLKRFEDSDAEVLSVYEQMHNENEAEKNALGHTERSTKKEGMVPAGVLGGLNVRDIHTGVEFSIGGGFLGQDPVDEGGQSHPSEYSRETLWRIKETLPGKIAKYKYFASGSKERPRFPVFLGWRDKIDL